MLPVLSSASVFGKATSVNQARPNRYSSSYHVALSALRLGKASELQHESGPGPILQLVGSIWQPASLGPRHKPLTAGREDRMHFTLIYSSDLLSPLRGVAHLHFSSGQTGTATANHCMPSASDLSIAPGACKPECVRWIHLNPLGQGNLKWEENLVNLSVILGLLNYTIYPNYARCYHLARTIASKLVFERGKQRILRCYYANLGYRCGGDTATVGRTDGQVDATSPIFSIGCHLLAIKNSNHILVDATYP